MVLSPVGATISSNIGKETQMQFAKPRTKNKEDNGTTGSAEHTKGARKSIEGRHEDGQARKLRDRGGSKGMKQKPRIRPKGHRGPWDGFGG